MFYGPKAKAIYDAKPDAGKVWYLCDFIEEAGAFLARREGIRDRGQLEGDLDRARRELRFYFARFMEFGFPRRLLTECGHIEETVATTIEALETQIRDERARLALVKQEYDRAAKSASGNPSLVPHDPQYLDKKAYLEDQMDDLRAEWRHHGTSFKRRVEIMKKGGLMARAQASWQKNEDDEQQRRAAVAPTMSLQRAKECWKQEEQASESRTSMWQLKIQQLKGLNLADRWARLARPIKFEASKHTRWVPFLKVIDETVGMVGLTYNLNLLIDTRERAKAILRRRGNVPVKQAEPKKAPAKKTQDPDALFPRPKGWTPTWDRPAGSQFRELTNLPDDWNVKKFVLIWRGEGRQEARIFATSYDEARAALKRVLGGKHDSWTTIGGTSPKKGRPFNFQISKAMYDRGGA